MTELVNDYVSRINKYHRLEIIQIVDSNIKKEEEKILSLIKDEYVITLDIEGKMLTSMELSTKLNDLFISGRSNISFVIGGSLGLGEGVKNRSDFSLSFSRMTFPHGLFRALLLEQVYRAFKIINNESYHK